MEQMVQMMLLRILLQKGLSDRAIEGKTESKVVVFYKMGEMSGTRQGE